MKKLAQILLIVGGLNWGLHAFDINLVNMIFGFNASIERIVYILVGVSAIICIKDCGGDFKKFFLGKKISI